MKDLISFIISFCVVSCIVGGLSIIFPDGRLSKSVKYVAVLSLICAFSGIFFVNFKVSTSGASIPSYQAENDSDIYLAELIFENALKTNGISYEKIDFLTDKTYDGSIIISKVLVYSDCPEERIKEIIGNDAEYEVEVIDE